MRKPPPRFYWGKKHDIYRKGKSTTAIYRQGFSQSDGCRRAEGNGALPTLGAWSGCQSGRPTCFSSQWHGQAVLRQQEDPIPAAKGMEYTYGLYYTDPEDGKLYRCERTGEQPGGKVTLQFLPHELVGLYFTEV